MTNIVRLKQGEARPICSIYEVQEVEKPENFVIASMLRKVGKYKDKPRIVLQNKILFKCGFTFGTNIKLIPSISKITCAVVIFISLSLVKISYKLYI